MSRLLLKSFAAAGLVAAMAAGSAASAAAAPVSAVAAHLVQVQTAPVGVAPAYWVYRHHHKYWVKPRPPVHHHP